MIEAGDLLVYPWKDGKPGHIGIVVTGFDPTMPMTRANDAVQRALRFVDTGKYKLGRGGYKFNRTTPMDADGFCDCTGFAPSWCYQMPRQDKELKLWWNTTAICHDALGKQLRFQLIKHTQDLAALQVVHCHGPSPSKKNPNPPPAISRASGLLWKRKKAIVVRVKGDNE